LSKPRFEPFISNYFPIVAKTLGKNLGLFYLLAKKDHSKDGNSSVKKSTALNLKFEFLCLVVSKVVLHGHAK